MRARVFREFFHSHGSTTMKAQSWCVHTHIRQSLICACVPTDSPATRIPRDTPIICTHTYTHTHTRARHEYIHVKIRTRTKAYESPRTTTPPLARCYCCDLMKCYGRPPAITFPLHRLTPHLYGSIPRDEIPFFSMIPRAMVSAKPSETFRERLEHNFCLHLLPATLLKRYSFVRRNLFFFFF